MSKLPFEKIEREILEKRRAKTDKKFGCPPTERPLKTHIDLGVICINKPKGPTSHQVSAYLQKILKIKKAGHGGTLDPKVTGVLPTAIGRATKIVQTLLPAGKEYVCIMHLHKEVDPATIKKVMKSFIGKIRQLPPIKSAIKRQWRDRRIYYVDINEIKGQDILFTVGCEAGTYIRKLCHDMGRKMDTGGHMAELIRTKAGPFNDKEMYTLQEVTDAFHYANEGNETFIRKIVKPIEYAVTHLPKIWVLDSAISSLTHGADLKVPGLSKLHDQIERDQLVAVFSLKDELVAIGRSALGSTEFMKVDKGIAVKVNKVFMATGTYPRMDT
jgi:H/ACA ribonucleoprotein complex subunit 4